MNDSTLKKVGWIAAATLGVCTLVGAAWLALEAQSTDPLPEIQTKAPKRIRSRGRNRPPKIDRRKINRPKINRPKGGVKSPKGTIRDHRKDRVGGPGLARPPLPSVKALRGRDRVRPAYRPGRLSPEELRKRREERRARQIDRLRNRIKTLDERIQNYRKDGTRTEAQIDRMGRSLERMRKRLTRMEDQQNKDK